MELIAIVIAAYGCWLSYFNTEIRMAELMEKEVEKVKKAKEDSLNKVFEYHLSDNRYQTWTHDNISINMFFKSNKKEGEK